MSAALMLLGTGSGVGKSLLTAGLCRLVKRAGVRVAPFKPQNMSNNAAVCPEGGEIGRAQALQALACGLPPHVDMNPVLIKPEADRKAQLIVLGRPRGTLHASRFREDRPVLLPEVLAAFERLRAAYDVVLVEGAGSLAEPNLREGDIANLGFATAADVEAWLVGDIDRGGVFASLAGSLQVLDAADRARVKGFVINRFRGDPSLLDDAIAWLDRATGVPLLGVVPHVPDLRLPEEDAPYSASSWDRPEAARARVAIVLTPTASNLSDFDALSLVPDLELRFVQRADELEGSDLVILAGSKAVQRDLAWLHEGGFASAIRRHLRYGGRVLGICGGLQFLGERIDDPTGLESGGSATGLGLLPIATELKSEKRVTEVELQAEWPASERVVGYEIHHGVTTTKGARPPFHAISDDGRIFGTYLHGLFDHAPYRDAVLDAWFGPGADGEPVAERWEKDLDRLADVLAEHLDLRDLEARVGTRLS